MNNLLKLIPKNPQYSPKTLDGFDMTDLEILHIAYQERMNICLIGGLNQIQPSIQLACDLQLPYQIISMYDYVNNNLDLRKHKYYDMLEHGGIFVFNGISLNHCEFISCLYDIADIYSLEFSLISIIPNNWFNERFMDNFDIVLDYSDGLEEAKNSIRSPYILDLIKKLRNIYPHEITVYPSVKMGEQLETNIQLFGLNNAKQMFVNKFKNHERQTVSKIVNKNL